MQPSIGILGGVGAIASARFHLDLVEAWAVHHKAEADDDFPRIVHLSQSLGLSAEGLTDSVTQGDILYLLTEQIMQDMDRVAVICNSIVPLLPSEREYPGILTPVAACRAALSGVKSAWLLASDSAIRDRIYQQAYPDIDWKVPSLSMTSWITALIGDAFAYRRIEELHLPAGELIVLGCTELSTRKLPFLCNPVLSPTDEMIKLLCS
jgi:aspartate/glutamate racemase